MAKNTLAVLLAENARLRKALADAEADKIAIRRATLQQTLDYATLALGRLGYGEKRLTDFETKLGEVALDYRDLVVADSKDDPEMWYYQQKLDGELRQYVGSRFEPYEKRYYGEVAE